MYICTSIVERSLYWESMWTAGMMRCLRYRNLVHRCQQVLPRLVPCRHILFCNFCFVWYVVGSQDLGSEWEKSDTPHVDRCHVITWHLTYYQMPCHTLTPHMSTDLLSRSDTSHINRCHVITRCLTCWQMSCHNPTPRMLTDVMS